MKHGSKPSSAVILSSKTASKPPPAVERDSLSVNVAETAPQDAVESSTASLAAATAAPTALSAVSLAPVPEDSSTVCKLESTLGGEEEERAEKKSEDSEMSEGQKDSTTTNAEVVD